MGEKGCIRPSADGLYRDGTVHISREMHKQCFITRPEMTSRAPNSGHASVQTSGFSLILRNRGKGGWARDLRGRRQNCLPRYSAGVKSRSVVLGYPT